MDPSPSDPATTPASASSAGELTDPPPGAEYRVQFRRLGEWRRVRTWLLVLIALMFIGGFFVWLMLPGHWHASAHHGLLRVTAIVMIVNTGIIGLFAFINLCTLCRASLLAHDPMPGARPRAARGSRSSRRSCPAASPSTWSAGRSRPRCASATTGRSTCGCSTRATTTRCAAGCRALGVHHFTRRGVEKWNQPRGAFKARSKHGNYNAWLVAHGSEYDFFISVDPDHVPIGEHGRAPARVFPRPRRRVRGRRRRCTATTAAS